MIRNGLAVVVGFLITFGLTTSMSMQRAEAAPYYEWQRFYYSDENFTTRVGGSHVYCNNRYTEWGQQTGFYMDIQDPCNGGEAPEPNCYVCLDGICSNWTCPVSP